MISRFSPGALLLSAAVFVPAAASAQAQDSAAAQPAADQPGTIGAPPSGQPADEFGGDEEGQIFITGQKPRAKEVHTQ